VAQVLPPAGSTLASTSYQDAPQNAEMSLRTPEVVELDMSPHSAPSGRGSVSAHCVSEPRA